MDKKGKIYLIPTTIAPGTEQQVLPLQITEAIRKLEYFLTENIRSARRFISSLNLDVDIQRLKFEALNKHSTPEDISYLMKPILDGRNAGVLSESGCPGIADPGARVVASAHRLNIKVVPLVGPSSLLLALMASGFNGQSFVFHGYLPIDKSERVKKLKVLEREAYNRDQTQIFIETPYRNNQLFKSIVQTCRPETLLCIAKNLTHRHEEVRSLSVAQWQKAQTSFEKLPMIFLIYHS